MGTGVTAAVETIDDLALPHRLVEQVVVEAIDVAHEAVDRLIAWAEGQRLRLLGALRDQGRSPLELLHGASVHCSTSQLSRAERRLQVGGEFPLFAEALREGEVSAAHLDRLAEAVRRLLSHERQSLADEQARLLHAACSGTAARFARWLRREVARLERLRPAADGAPCDPAEQRFAAQQAGARLTARTDRDTGMTIYRLALDPWRALGFDRCLAARVEALHHGPPIPGCPDDPLERQAFLRALALVELVGDAGSGRSGGRSAEIVVVVDHTAPAGSPDIDWGLPVDIPQRVLDALAADPGTRTHRVVVRNGVVIEAPGALDLGRSTRLASRAQRRALRALYRGCAMPGCDVAFDHCTIHHIRWWRHGGPTDLANLLPLCSRHHHLVHDRGWQVRLGRHRELVVTTPSGRQMSTGPPRRWAV